MVPLVLASALAAFPNWGGSNQNKQKSNQEKKTKEENRSLYELTPSCRAKQQEKVCNPTNWSIQARGGVFILIEKKLRKIYGSGIPTLEFEGSYSLLKDKGMNCDQLLLWGNVGWSSGSAHHTKMNLVPISAGLEYQIHFARYFDFYFGIGPAYSFLRVKNHHGAHHFDRDKFGFTTKTGFRGTFDSNVFIDIFADYYRTQFGRMHYRSSHINNNYSAFIVGAGIGYKW